MMLKKNKEKNGAEIRTRAKKTTIIDTHANLTSAKWSLCSKFDKVQSHPVVEVDEIGTANLRR